MVRSVNLYKEVRGTEIRLLGVYREGEQNPGS